MNFPWGKLTVFHSDSMMEMEDCFAIFYLCPALTHLHLRNISDDFDSDNHALVRMPELSRLRLASFGDMGRLLDNLVVPSLREIHLESNLGVMWPKSQLIALISRSSSPIEFLTIQQIGFIELDVAECFQSIQTLQDMFVIDRQTTKLFRRRTVQEDVESGSGVYEDNLGWY
jgi:hypothetical protein